MLTSRRLLVLLCDFVLVVISLCFAFLLTYDFQIPPEKIAILWECLTVAAVVKPLVFATTGFYSSIWRYASLRDAAQIIKGVTFASVVTVFALWLLPPPLPISRPLLIIDWFLLCAFIAGSRLLWRSYRERFLVRKSTAGPRTLIVGAGDAGNLLLKEIRHHPRSSYQVVGFVDDDPEKKGLKLQDIPILGNTSQLMSLIQTHRIEDVIIAMPSAPGKVIHAVIDSCKNAKVTFKTLPAIGSLIDGSISISQIKNVEIEDLLGRAPVLLDHDQIGIYLTGKRILVTGAGGSIGSEICRQVSRFTPGKLVIMDQAETPLYEIERELVTVYPQLLIIPLVADVRDKESLDAVFAEFLPEVVFHAAAYKHVPMMEYNPAQAVLNNIFGSRNVADAADRYKVLNVVMISTDKAVNPTNVMGATKRGAEIYIQALSLTSTTRFTTVRFGNVLGSSGSVIPLFKSQIAQGGPITVTDKRVIRYFMTIPEATQLVVQAGCMGKRSEILVLDMGDPVRIVDLAEELIRLSGLTPYEDIDIIFTGLRPGEKLFEELLIDGEGVKPTSHDKIKVLAPVTVDIAKVRKELEVLYEAARTNAVDKLIESMRRLVPEFTPTYSFQGGAPDVFKRVRPDLFPKAAASKGKKIVPIRK